MYETQISKSRSQIIVIVKRNRSNEKVYLWKRSSDVRKAYPQKTIIPK